MRGRRSGGGEGTLGRVLLVPGVALLVELLHRAVIVVVFSFSFDVVFSLLSSLMLRSTAPPPKTPPQTPVKRARPHDSDARLLPPTAITRQVHIRKRGRFTIVRVVVHEVVIEHQALDALLLGALGFLLRAHGDGETRVRGEIDGAGLQINTC